MQTTIAAIYVKVTSPTVAEAEVDELLERLAKSGCHLASDDATKDVDDFYDEPYNLLKWADTKNFDMVCIRRAVNLDDRDTYLTFIQNLYCGNVALLGLKGN